MGPQKYSTHLICSIINQKFTFSYRGVFCLLSFVTFSTEEIIFQDFLQLFALPLTTARLSACPSLCLSVCLSVCPQYYIVSAVVLCTSLLKRSSRRDRFLASLAASLVYFSNQFLNQLFLLKNKIVRFLAFLVTFFLLFFPLILGGLIKLYL